MTWKRTLRSALYGLGILSAFHRVRNRNTLTVVAFHRVLPEDDARWPTADPMWTTTVDCFRSCLRFFRRHYRVLSLDEVLDHVRGGPAPRGPALLITFDDGWADNAEYALPCLSESGLPAVVFVVSGTVGSQRAFWEEELFALWRTGAVSAGEWRELWRASGPDDSVPSFEEGTGFGALQARLRDLPAARRSELLAAFESPAPRSGQPVMADGAQLRALSEGRVAVGAHGATHAPLTLVENLEEELGAPRRELPKHTGRAVDVLAFPHGRYNADVVKRAFDHGYKAVFSSEAALYRLPLKAPHIGRISLPAPGLVHGEGIDRGALASYLFLRERRDANSL